MQNIKKSKERKKGLTLQHLKEIAPPCQRYTEQLLKKKIIYDYNYGNKYSAPLSKGIN